MNVLMQPALQPQPPSDSRVVYVILTQNPARCAAACVRRELVPLALDAYPEAYEEFKRCMLVFVFGPEAHGSTVGELWAVSTRAAVAAQLARTLRQAAGAGPGLLPLLAGLITPAAELVPAVWSRTRSRFTCRLITCLSTRTGQSCVCI